MNRKEFLELSTAILSGFLVHQGLGRSAQSQSRDGEKDDFYLRKGLTGMARAPGWFAAHWGAAVLAGHYLCHENDLGEETTRAIYAQLDTLIASRPAQFAPSPEQDPDAALIEQIPRALEPAIQGGLRAHGHAVIFASLSVRALREAPHLAQPHLIQDLCKLSSQIARKEPEKPEEAEPYPDTQAMIKATFESLARFERLLGRPRVRRPNFTHMVTHTEALTNLKSMGYDELSVEGHAGHRAHIAAPVPDFDPADHPVVKQQASLEELMSPDFWKSERNVTRWKNAWSEFSNPNGYWVAFGHLFKVLYSYHRLIEQTEDDEQVRLCSMILLERYLNPDVRGG